MGTRRSSQRSHFAPPPEKSSRFRSLLTEGQTELLALLAENGATPERVAEKYRIEEDGFTRATRRYYDTFNWSLYKQDRVLMWEDERYSLRSTVDGSVLQRTSAPESVRYGADLPAGPLRDQVAPAAGIRALLETARVEITARRYAVLNEDDKTVVRLELRELAAGDETRLDLIVLPVRGYKNAQQTLISSLEEAGFAARPGYDVYRWALTCSDRQPGAYSAKPTFPITPDMRADEAAKIILRALQQVIRENEAGIQADLDTEFLHDFRTAVRRTRSALSQIKGVFPAETTEQAKQAFRGLGQLTNELRDLDVYLLSRDRYRALLPDALQADIDPMFDFLADKRTGARQRVVTGLQSAEYEALMTQWAAFLNEAPSAVEDAPKAGQPIAKLARRRLLKRYRRLIDEGNRILEEQDDALMHALRIDGKKLRYLMEFFAAILPKQESKRLIKQLKRLQDNLGEFNDLTVQQAYLLHVADELPLDDPRMRRTLVAIGVLIEQLARRQAEVRAAFAEIFAAFAAPANQQAFARLLEEETEEPPP